MNNPFRMIVFSLLFCLAAGYGFAQQNALQGETPQERKFVFETSVGAGAVNNHVVQSSFSLRSGFNNYFLTARFIRSDLARVSIYENCWLAGYRFHFGKLFNSTVSVGAGDIAFVAGYYSQEKDIDEAVGLTFDAELQWKIHRNGNPTCWAMFTNYYTTFNKYNNLNGFSAGFSFSPRSGLFSPKKKEREQFADDLALEKEEQQKQHNIKKAERAERNNKLHWEMYAFAGTAKRPFNGGFGMFFEKNKIILGANFTWESQVLWKEPYHAPNFPPQITSYHYFKDKQYENALFAGYRVSETEHVAFTIAAGPVWKRNITLIGHEESYRMWYTKTYEVKTVTGVTIQSELSYTFRGRKVGFGLIPFVNIYKGYVSRGIVLSLRLGILR